MWIYINGVLDTSQDFSPMNAAAANTETVLIGGGCFISSTSVFSGGFLHISWKTTSSVLLLQTFRAAYRSHCGIYHEREVINYFISYLDIAT